MQLVIVLLVGLLVGLALGGTVGWLVARSRVEEPAEVQEPAEDPAVVEERHARVVAEVQHREAVARAQVESRLSAAQASLEGLQQALETAQQQYRETVDAHRREAQERQAAGQSESKVLQQLAPVATQLRSMQQKVDELEKQRSAQHGDLAAQIRATRESAEQSKAAATMLSDALRNNAIRGVYGETQLKSLVESAGLLHRVDFHTQESIVSEAGARRPDMVLRLPGDKQMAVDAKVPFSAFIESKSAEIDDDRRKQLCLQHARQVRAHVDALSDKQYWSGLSASPEFTVAFIPNDSILYAALDADPALMQHAFDRGVVLATPVNLWAVLKTVAFTWRQEVLTENAKELFDLGNELYSRLGTMAEKVAKLGRSIEGTVKGYNEFVGSLERRVLASARKFDGLDKAAVLPELSEIDGEKGDTRSLAASEFLAFEDLERPELDLELAEGVIVEDEHTA